MATKKTSGKQLADMLYGGDQMRATPQSRITGPIANAVRKAQQFASQYELDPRIPLLGGTGVDELLSLPDAASLLEDVSYNGMGALVRGGNAATGGLGTFRPDPRIMSAADVAATATGVGQLGSMAVKAAPGAIKAGARNLSTPRTLNPQAGVIKMKGGNWLGGSIMGNIDENVKRLKPYTRAGAQADFLQKDLVAYEAALERLKNDKYTLPQSVQAQQDVVDNIKKKIAINNWVESNLGKYVKNQMATPEDPIRLLLDKRTKEIEAKHAKDMERAERMAQRVIDETDPRRQANMIRESERLKMEANVERQFAMDSIIPSRMQDYSPDADQYLKQRRQEAGFPAEGMGESEAAKRYETLTDDAISTMRAGDVQAVAGAMEESKAALQLLRSKEEEIQRKFNEHVLSKGLSEGDLAGLNSMPMKDKAAIIQDPEYQELFSNYSSKSLQTMSPEYVAAQQNPFISKLDPETQLYSGNTADMGFDHVIDILKQDVMEGRIRPEQLSKVSVEDAVRRTMDFDQEAAKKMAEAQFKATEGFPTYKEYPEGYRWIELAPPAPPQVLPEGWTMLEPKAGLMRASSPDGEKVLGNDLPELIKNLYNRHPDTPGNPRQMLEDALKYEGETMGHCVGGYCPDVMEGKSRIYSLRDAKGEPHVTVEVAPKYYNIEQARKVAEQEGLKGFEFGDRVQKLLAGEGAEQEIVQIKGKQNAAPKDAYLPYVQDFVRSGQWSDVGDLGNTGLYRADPSELGMFVPSDPRLQNLPGRRTEDFQRAKEAGLFGDQKYFTRNEWEDILRKQIESESGQLPPVQPEGMKRGGRVHFSDNPDVMQLELAGGGGVKALLKAAKAAVKPVKGTQEVLPAAEREANLAKMLEGSAVKSQLYHGTGKDIKKFDKSKLRRTGFGEGFHLAESPNLAGFYANQFDEGQNVMPVHVAIKNPYELEKMHDWFDLPGRSDKDKTDFLKSQGYDGIKYPHGAGPNQSPTAWVAFEPTQIKSATGNRGTYDIDDPDITKAAGGAVKMAGGGAVHMVLGGLARAGAKGAAKGTKEAVKPPIKASEALGQIEGRPLVITQADRTKVGGGYLGGPGFSGLQLEDPAYRAAEAAWAVKNPGTAKMILGGNKAAGKDPVFAAMLGTPTQHQSNQMVFDKLYGDFKKAAKKGDLDPELKERINLRLASTVDKNGNPIFPADIDILDKNFKNIATTFDQRAVTANLIGGMGVGGKKGQIIDYDKIIRNTTDPALIDAPTGALGNRLFTLSGGVVERPDLHPAFPTILQGEDLGVSFDPVARELIMKDFTDKTMREKGRAPGYMDYTRGYPPSQLITEDILTEMQKLGLKKGGAVKVEQQVQVSKPAKKKSEQSVQNPVHFTDSLDAMRLALTKRN
jgi:hypothetical protein